MPVQTRCCAGLSLVNLFSDEKSNSDDSETVIVNHDLLEETLTFVEVQHNVNKCAKKANDENQGILTI